MRTRSAMREDSASSARVARSSALSRRCSSRASAWPFATSDVTNVKLVNPRYSMLCSAACTQVHSGIAANNGISASVSIARNNIAHDSGMIHGSTPAITSSRMPCRPLAEKYPIAAHDRLIAIKSGRRSASGRCMPRSRVRNQYETPKTTYETHHPTYIDGCTSCCSAESSDSSGMPTHA
jgi:hypothetical protein